MAGILAKRTEEVETWTEDEVSDFMTEHFSEEVASKFKGKLASIFFCLRKDKLTSIHVEDFFSFQT